MTVSRGPGATPPVGEGSNAINALAREIAERNTGMPAYLVDDEQWAVAEAEARATYRPAAPLSPLQEAIRKAAGKNPTADEIEASIRLLNRAAAVLKRRKP